MSTQSNIITINQLAYFTFKPLRLGIAVAHSRHSLALIREEREFIVNIPDVGMLEAVKLCGSVSGRAGDKFKAAGLEREAALEVAAAAIARCPARIECRVERCLEFEDRNWFIGLVVAAAAAPTHRGADALMCGRQEYSVPGDVVGTRK